MRTDLLNRLLTTTGVASSNGAASAIRSTLDAVASPSCTWQMAGTRAILARTSHSGIVSVLTYTTSGLVARSMRQPAGTDRRARAANRTTPSGLR